MAGDGQALHVGGAGAAPGIDAQRHRRAFIGGLQQGLPLARPVMAQALDPPGGVVPGADRRLLDGGDQRRALAHEAAQHGIDEGHRRRRALARGRHGLVDQGVIRIGR
jgi:hypothetical protein